MCILTNDRNKSMIINVWHGGKLQCFAHNSGEKWVIQSVHVIIYNIMFYFYLRVFWQSLKLYGNHGIRSSPSHESCKVRSFWSRFKLRMFWDWFLRTLSPLSTDVSAASDKGMVRFGHGSNIWHRTDCKSCGSIHQYTQPKDQFGAMQNSTFTAPSQGN